MDQPLMTIEQSSFRCRFAYARAGETAQYKDNNQDYLAFRIDGGSLSFVLCDGVSLSYQGDFAARFLGAHLLDWIAVQSELNAESLHAYLDSLRDAAAEQMSGLPIPSGLPPLVKEVLEDKKRIGSEAMFTCGRIDGTDGTDEAEPYSRIWLAWHGDGDVGYGSMDKKAAICSRLPAQVENGGQSIVVSSAEELIPCTTILKAMHPFG
ncbi:hypothetical protein [Paenibacillus alvei]|uniref:hypothetical protein n=1 Tax=Paenibacillus alvei TaxID=44250 RepID=UPI001F20B4C3|nr:hypothetical protein [Paenibacillus alvei]